MESAIAMHVAINAQLLSSAASYRSAGVSMYSRQLLMHLGEAATCKTAPHHITAFSHVGFDAPGLEIRRSHLPLDRPALRIAWEQCVLPLHLRRIQADLVHGLVNVLPLATTVPGVVTVHDLSFLRLPHLFPPLKQTYLTWLARASVTRARRVIAVSRQTARDLHEIWRVPSTKISVIYNGVADRFQPPDANQIEEFRRRRGLPTRYLLYLGTLEPRKNLGTLLAAFARWRRQAGAVDQDLKLVIAGGKGWYYETIFSQVAALDLEDSIVFPGYLPAEELPAWYSAATAFVFPSRYEGFGLPVLEAMACGTPVLCSNAPGVAEVAADAALTVPAQDVDAWTAGLALLTGQADLRAELNRRGYARAAAFSWRSTAEATLEVYEAALAG